MHYTLAQQGTHAFADRVTFLNVTMPGHSVPGQENAAMTRRWRPRACDERLDEYSDAIAEAIIETFFQ